MRELRLKGVWRAKREMVVREKRIKRVYFMDVDVRDYNYKQK